MPAGVRQWRSRSPQDSVSCRSSWSRVMRGDKVRARGVLGKDYASTEVRPLPCMVVVGLEVMQIKCLAQRGGQ